MSNTKMFIYRMSKPIENIQLNSCFEEDKFIVSVKQNIMTKVVEKTDEIILELLYKEFLESEATDLFILDQTEFKKFLMKYIPIYMKEKELGKENNYVD